MIQLVYNCEGSFFNDLAPPLRGQCQGAEVTGVSHVSPVAG